MRKTASLTIGFVTLLVVLGSYVSAAEPADRASFDPVAKVTTITTRDGNGRAQKFTDAGNREFVVKYNEQHRVASVEETRGPNASDIVSVGYAPDGKLIGVRFRTGYTLFFDTRPNGVQLIRDSRGGALIRTGQAAQPLDNASAEQSTKLAATITQLDSLLSALGQPPR